ncbi:twin-arginine translocation signal domain-containing protein [Halovivax limisalsi]|uniref:twin-arginine translocation signal domain-containing protein n=1 Tax=Halovivax limisalsi TaxID=1453760 RepID=UPI001FFDD032|nr:twin-arginine translocation signal domain-containing protein [Halovivax limisalsi]
MDSNPRSGPPDGARAKSARDERRSSRSPREPTGRQANGTASRRRFLRAGGAVGLTALAGCTEDVGSELPENRAWPIAGLLPSLPFETRADRFDARLESAAAEPIDDVNAFTEVVQNRVSRLDSIEEDRDVLAVEYVTDVDRSDGVGHDIAAIAGAYAALIEAGYQSYALTTTIREAPSGPVGSAVVYTEWAVAYNEGRYDTGEYRELVWTTIESTRHPPAIEVEPDE